MCKQTPASCPECKGPLEWVAQGAAVCGPGDHSVWLPALTIPSGHRYNVRITGEVAPGTVVFQEECPNCTWPDVDHRFLPDLHGKPGPWAGTTWWTARHLRPGMRVHMAFGYALTVAEVTPLPGRNGQPDRTCLVLDRAPRCGEPINVGVFADAPECVEGTAPSA